MQRRRRKTLSLTTTASVLLYAFCVAWILGGLIHVWGHPAIGWLPLPIMAGLATYESFKVFRRADLSRPTRRFWGQIAVVAAAVGVAAMSNMADALLGHAPSQRIGPRTLALYGVVVVMALYALLRLPSWTRSRLDWARFALDASIVLIASTAVNWHFSVRIMAAKGHEGSSLTALVVVAGVAIASITFMKVAFAGAGQLDRRALHIMAGGALLGGATGSITPLLLSHPYLSSTILATAASSFTTQLAARRQFRVAADAAVPPPAVRRFSLLPYVAAGVISLLLVFIEAPRGGEGLVIALCAVALTGLVMIRQFAALRENSRLLDTVDTNVRQLSEFQNQLAHRVTHDALTEIPNRALFSQRVAEQLEKGETFHVALLDLDDFKTVNDRLGHSMGDALLKAVSRRLHEALRPGDMVARLGGDEFTLLLPGRSADRVAVLLRHLVAAVQQPMLLDEQDMIARISVGVTESGPGDTPEELLRRADVAMYAAKNAGGGRWTWFDPIMDKLADADARLGNDLRHAIARDELFVLYQPIVELPHGRLVGVEALVRWRHPTLGLVSPAVFIPLAERNGTILEIGWWVLQQVVRQAAEWDRTYGENGPEKVSVNISARQLGEPDFPARVGELLRESGVDPYLLVAEVTETAVLGTGEALAAVRELHELGLRVALDDFGTGQSSLSLLVETPVGVLKVDKSFVDGVTASSPQAVIVDGLIGITDGLRIEAVAEGVETAEQAERLHAVGYRYAQGFHFARPMPPEDIALLLSAPDNGHRPSSLAIPRRSGRA